MCLQSAKFADGVTGVVQVTQPTLSQVQRKCQEMAGWKGYVIDSEWSTLCMSLWLWSAVSGSLVTSFSLFCCVCAFIDLCSVVSLSLL